MKMDVKNLHVVYNGGTGLAAAHALIVASGEASPSITQSHTSDAIRRHSDGTSINWPKVLKELKRSPAAGEGG
jgi:hypothetical protein